MTQELSSMEKRGTDMLSHRVMLQMPMVALGSLGEVRAQWSSREGGC